MEGLPQLQEISLKSYMNEIEKSINCKNFLSALVLALILPDICSKYLENYNCNDNGKGYKDWFDKYVYNIYYKQSSDEIGGLSNIEFDGKRCYALRCSILHEGIIPFEQKNNGKIYNITELAVNGNSSPNKQAGECKMIRKINNVEQRSCRINVVKLAQNMINGCNTFLSEIGEEDIKLFFMIDLDKKENLIFTPKE